MMAAKKTTVTLVSDGGSACEFEFEHAERLLRIPRCGWKLHEDSPFEFVENALHRRANKGKVKEK